MSIPDPKDRGARDKYSASSRPKKDETPEGSSIVVSERTCSTALRSKDGGALRARRLWRLKADAAIFALSQCRRELARG